MLLKLKSKEFLDTDQDERKNTEVFKRKVNNAMLLDKYIEFVMRKKLTKPDERLMDVLGFKDAFKLITDAKAEK